jgi:GNAT superfamily N-acetyltransferase
VPPEVLTRRWVAAWAHVRGLEVGEVAGWPLVYVGSASRATEIVCAEPAPATWATLTAMVAGRPTATLSVVSSAPEGYVAALPVGVRVDRDDETLMSLDHRADVARSGVDVSGYDIDREDDGDRVTVRLVTDGRVAAEGTAGLLGRDAVYDMVETTPAYRRRGLAGWVMADLTTTMGERGAGTGLLVATPAGARLYRRLGWGDVAPFWMLRGES